jgi:hypothetical protein
MKVTVSHQKLLGEAQFEGIKGSAQHAAMSMNRVWINLLLTGNRGSRETQYHRQLQVVRDHLRETCKSYYFIGRRGTHDGDGDTGIRIYFLSKKEMEDFLIWAKLRLPAAADIAD